VEPAEEEYLPAHRLFQDALLGLYKGSPRLKPVEEVTPSFRLNYAVLGKAMEECAFEELRLRTRIDSTMAMLGAANLWEQLMGLLTGEQQEAARQAAEQEAQAARQEARAETLLALAAAADETGGGAGNEGQSAQYRREAAALQAQARAAEQEAEVQIAQALDAGPSDQAIHRAVKQAAQNTAKQAGSLDGWGLAPGALQRVSPEERLALAQRVMQSQKLHTVKAFGSRRARKDAKITKAFRAFRAFSRVSWSKSRDGHSRRLPSVRPKRSASRRSSGRRWRRWPMCWKWQSRSSTGAPTSVAR